MSRELSCFGAYDVRGRVPGELDEDIARRIGRACAAYLSAKTPSSETSSPDTPSGKTLRMVVGHDVRLSSPGLCAALCRGLTESGLDVMDIGRCGTEEMYFATARLQADGGVMVTASHNPRDYNGMKFVRENARPLSGDSGLGEIRRLAEQDRFPAPAAKGRVSTADTRPGYIEHLLTYVDTGALKPLRIVCNAGNGGAGAVIDELAPHLPFEFIKLQHAADGHFPHGVPNPLLEENRAPTAEAVRRHGADIGIAWDGDFDRCFFFDARGRFIEAYYIVGLLAQSFLAAHPGAKIVHDPRLTWNTRDIVQQLGGTPVCCKTGHAFIKERMGAEDAVYGGEMSGHHYFRDFFYCDSGMIPWLLLTGLMSRQNQSLAELVDERMAAFPASGEINSKVDNPPALLKNIESAYAADAESVEHIDGLSVSFPDWRFNLRMSNTEPVLRLNVESRGDGALMEEKTRELLKRIRA